MNCEYMMKHIRTKYPKAKIRVFGYDLYIVEDGIVGHSLGAYASSPESAIKKAYKMVQYN